MLNAKQESCEYQLLKPFGLTRPGNRTLAYRLRGEQSNHWATSQLRDERSNHWATSRKSETDW